MRQSWNLQALWEGLCLLLFASLFAFWLLSDIYRAYVHPRYLIPLWISDVVLVLWALLRLQQGRGRRYRSSYRFGWMFLLPAALLALTFPSESAVATKTQTGAPLTHVAVDAADWTHRVEATTRGPGIYFRTKDYYQTLIETTQSLDDKLGERVVITGFVVRDPKLYTQGDFYVGRLAMTCCVADVLPLGVVVFADQPERYETDGWYTVEGTLRAASFHGMNQVAVQATKITPAQPIEGYIYP